MDNNRRDFLKDTASKALWAAPVLTVLMSASAIPATANGGSGTTSTSASSTKVDVCHKGNTINVAPSAVPAHIAHGDSLGACSN
jgi:hypothetical protein